MQRLCHVIRRPRLAAQLVVTPVLLLSLSGAALAVNIPTDTVRLPGAPPAPTSGNTAPPAADTTTPTTPAATAPATPTKRRFYVVRTLGIGSSGTPVRNLQRRLRVHGQRFVRVDGDFGRQTQRGVRRVQKKFRMRTTGTADLKLLRRLKVKLRYRVAAAAPTRALTTPLRAVPVDGAKYLRTFPVLGDYTYSSDFGAPRHQGSHEGNDIMADRGTPVVAVADGTIKRMTRTETGLGGIWIWLLDTSGNEYYYAHLTNIAAGLSEGTRVRTGEVIGTVGNTGDARYGAPHLHFEIHPGGGSATNPYNELRAVDPKLAAR
ncbi:MAG: peptidoglycan DD-metalloendopeptidase family protein [Thermoleophilia bacterium]|nr:peptidoglycan DD-metalloendopeptidase family protein [Thermoleophilia bacterium]